MNQPQQMPDIPTPPPPAAQVPATGLDSRVKSPMLALILSLAPGLGQIYVGYYQRGFVHFFTVATVITLLANGVLGPLDVLAGLFLAFFWLYNVIDAYRRASLYNRALAGEEDIELPRDFDMPGYRGSLGGGLTLVAVGAILLMNTRFDMSLAWVEDWWPAAIILFGAYLVFKAMQERAGSSGEESE